VKESVHVNGRHVFPAPFGQYNLRIDLSLLPSYNSDEYDFSILQNTWKGKHFKRNK